MKLAPEYVAQALTEQAAEHLAQGYCPLSFDEPATRFVPRETAERAVGIALAEAERYRQLLVGAALRAKSSTPSADVAIPTP